MTIEKIIEEKAVTLKLDGWLDTVSSQDLAVAIEEIQEASAIVLDFDKVEYISSAGVRQVVSCAKKAKDLSADFSVIKAGKEVMSIFSLTCLDKKINIVQK